MAVLSTCGILLALAVICAMVLQQRHKIKYEHLPPGPPPSPLFGNRLSKLYPWRTHYALSKKYGPIITVWNGRKPSVVCSTVKSVSDVLEKQARDTADRPRQVVGGEIFSNGMRILIVPYSDRWRRMRKALHHHLQPESARNFRGIQEAGAQTLIGEILDSPDDFQLHIKTYTATIVVNIGYGRTEKVRYSDPDIQQIIEGMDRLGQLLQPGAWAVDSLPILRFIPGYLSVPYAWAAEELDLFRRSLADARKKLSSGNLNPCFAKFITEKQAEFNLSDDEAAYLCGSIFGAGSDTSSSAITTVIMAAACHPEQQKAVQEELDRVVGSDRLPNFDDFEDLPLVRAFVNESYRWRPVSSGGFLHKATADVVYDGYFIPAGTTVSGNHWAIHRDEAYYGSNVEAFDMYRWLNDDRSALKGDMRHFQFGFGRRVCPGQHVANNSLFINCAMLLWSFDIAKKKDQAGKTVEIDTLAFTNTANSHPQPFEVDFTARHHDLEAILASAMVEM